MAMIQVRDVPGHIYRSLAQPTLAVLSRGLGLEEAIAGMDHW
jgi:hypothetical protein